MGTIQRMKVLGLRAFSPYEEDGNDKTNIIKFSSPLTLILGENGCGKTTIIEALKFACSGDMPGGTKSGQGFVNDPRLSSQSTTKGQVVLKFADAKGIAYLVSKSIQVTNKGATSTSKRLDSTLQRMNPDGSTQSLSSRCANIDADICEIMGVSKAILNNVIFCHQEDSAWPLDEPKKLKEKFDEIFGATEYNKCVETIRKAGKERKNDNKVLQAKVGSLQQAKEIVDKKRDEEREKTEKFEKFQDVISDKEKSLVPITTRLQEICDLEINLGKLQQNCTQKETIKAEIIKQQKDILKNITEEFAGSDEELQTKISTFDVDRGKTKEKRRILETKKETKESEKNGFSNSIGKLQIKMGKLQGEKNQQQQTIIERDNSIVKACNNLKITVPSTYERNDVINAIDGIRTNIENSKTSLENLTRESDEEESQLQKLIYEKRNELGKVTHGIESKQQQIQEFKGKTRDINSQLRELDYSDEQLKTLQNKITRIEKDLTSCKSSFNADDISKKIEDDKQKIRREEEKQETLEREYKILQQNSITEAELETQRHELVKRKSEVDNLKDKHYESFTKIFNDEIPAPGFIKKSVENHKQRNTNIINETNKKTLGKQKEQITLETKCKIQKEKLKSLETELRESEKQVFQLCKGKQFDIMSNEIHQAIEKLQKDKGQYSSAKIMYEKFVQDFQSQKPCCPVCRTDFNNKQAAVTEIVKTIRSKIQGIPQELKKVEEELKLKQELYSNLLQLKPSSDKIEELNATLIPKSRSDLTDFTSFHERVSKELADLNEQLINPQAILNACNEISGAAALIDQHQLEINRSELKIRELEAQLVQVPSNRSRQQAEVELEDLKVDISNLRRNTEVSQKKLQQHNERCQELREEKSKHVEKQLGLQKAMQGKPQLQEQLVELAEKEQTLKTEIAELQMQVNPLKTELKDAEGNKEAVKQNNRKKLTEKQSEVNRNQKILDDINKLQKNIDAYITRGGDAIFEATLEELTELKQKVTTLDEDIKEIVKEITEVNKELVNQDAMFRTLNDNSTLRKKRQEEESLSNEITDLKRQIGDYNYRTVLTEKQRLRQEDDDLRSEINTCKGRNDMLKQELKSIKAELNTPAYKQAHTNYKKGLIELMCAKKMADDLELYMKALERGVLKFHQERMSQINKRIRQLWRSIYRGNDCDYIEIKTDETKTSTVRRTYNYKVVQMKADVEIDMRGRCSAGQKVLACLVIRMALAETFSKNCGILALDEPTTNLDRANISSLSDALARIVNTRQAEKNFQLLIITHDEDFLSSLTRVDKVSHFLRVSRNDKGNSIITREPL